MEIFYFGVFFGLCIMLLILTIILVWVGHLDIDEDPQFEAVFPIFRGIGIIVIYIWLPGWNVFGWTSSNINYRLIFEFNYHYSAISEILRRASLFTTIYLVIMVLYTLTRLNLITNFIPAQYLPMMTWILLIAYLLYPSKKHFNGKGR